MTLLEQAADFRQYDALDMDWEGVGTAASPHRQFMSRAINLQSAEVQGNTVLEVGCGSGWFLKECLDHGAAQVTGVEPSKYAELAAKTVPEATIIKRTFQEFETNKQFDFVSFVMCTEHMPDLPHTLTKANHLLKKTGNLLILAADAEAFMLPRYDYELQIEPIQPGKEAVVEAKRPTDYGTTTDIVRSVDYWLDTAREAGFDLTSHQPVMADDKFISQKPKYELFRNRPLFQLFRFTKVRDVEI